jgi:hypothetical protein
VRRVVERHGLRRAAIEVEDPDLCTNKYFNS